MPVDACALKQVRMSHSFDGETMQWMALHTFQSPFSVYMPGPCVRLLMSG